MKVPKGWHEQTLSQYLELRSLEFEDFASIEDYNEERLKIILDDDDIVENLSTEELTNSLSLIKWSKQDPTKDFKKQIGEYHFKEFKLLKLGEFIDLEYYCQDVKKNASKIIAILLRKTKVGDWGELIFEPYKVVNVEQRASEMLEQKASDVFGIIKAYIDFSKDFKEKRKSMFEGEDDEDEDEESEEPTTAEDRKEDRAEKSKKKWAWEILIYNLMRKDLTKFEDVTDLDLHLVFLFGAMKMELKLD